MDELRHEIQSLRAQVATLQQENSELKSSIRRKACDNSSESRPVVEPPALSTAFYEMPTELLDMIVEASSQGIWAVSPVIWRLVHPRFSYLESMMKSLFQEIRLQPSLYFSKRDLQALDALVPYVQRVRFIQAYVQRSQSSEEELDPGENTSARMDRVYEENSYLLQDYRVHFESGVQQDYFVAALRTLINVRWVTMSYDEPVLWNALKFPREDQAYVLAIECLRRAGTCIEDLSLELNGSAITDSDLLRSNATWQAWDLTALKRLHIEGYESEEEAPSDMSGPERPELEQILTKSSSSLVELRLDNCGTLFQLPMDLCMGQLRRLRLEDVHLDVPNFATWISSLPQLQDLEIRESNERSWCDVGFCSLKPLFDSIRNHESKMQVTFDPLYIWLHETSPSPIGFHLNYHTATPRSAAVFTWTSNAEMQRKCRAVIDYLSKSTEWTLADDD